MLIWSASHSKNKRHVTFVHCSPIGTADISASDFNPRLLILGFQSEAFNPMPSILAFQSLPFNPWISILAFQSKAFNPMLQGYIIATAFYPNLYPATKNNLLPQNLDNVFFCLIIPLCLRKTICHGPSSKPNTNSHLRNLKNDNHCLRHVHKPYANHLPIAKKPNTTKCFAADENL